MTATRVALAGSTGSIGTQALDVLVAEADRFELSALGATGRDPQVLIDQARTHRPKVVAVADEAAARVVAEALPECEVRGGRRRHGQPGHRGRRRGERRGRLRRAPGHPGHPRGRPPPGAGQQGVADRRRSRRAAGPPHARAPSWCPSTASTAPSTSASGPPTTATASSASCSPPAAGPSGAAPPPSWPTVTVDRGAGPPHLEHGPQDHRRLLDAHEQGPRGHRGPRAVRRAGGGAGLRPRLRPASTWWCTRSRSCTPWSSSPTPATIAQLSTPDMRLPDRLRPGLARPHRHPVRPHRLDPAGPPRLRAAGPRHVPLPAPGLRGRPHRRHRPGLAQRRQRGRRRGVPPGSHPVGRHLRGDRGHPRRP